MRLCDEVSFNYNLPVDEMCLISAIPLNEIMVKMRNPVDVKIRYKVHFIKKVFLSLNGSQDNTELKPSTSKGDESIETLISEERSKDSLEVKGSTERSASSQVARAQ